MSFRFFSNLKNIGQNWHLKASCGKIPWIDAQCFFKSIPANAFSQTSQVTFVCSILTWLRNLAEVGNFRWHVSHWNFILFRGFQIFFLKGVFATVFAPCLVQFGNMLAICWIIFEHFSRNLWFSPESGATRPSNLFWRLPHCQPIFAPPTLPVYFGASHPSNLFWRTHPPNLFCRPPPSSLFCGLPRFQLPLAHPSGHSCQYLRIRVQHWLLIILRSNSGSPDPGPLSPALLPVQDCRRICASSMSCTQAAGAHFW